MRNRKRQVSRQERVTGYSLVPHVGTGIHTLLWKFTSASVSGYIRNFQVPTLWHLRDLVLESCLNCLDDILICLTAYE